MTSLETFDSRVLGVVVTGRIGHRGSDSTSFFDLVSGVRQVFPLAELVFSSSSEPGEEIRSRLVTINCPVVVQEFTDDPTLTYGMNSLVRQTQQVQSGIELFSDAVQNVIRIRSDWLLTNLESFGWFVKTSVSSSALTFLDVNWPKFPWVPSPWQGNDYVTVGDVKSVSKFWGSFLESDIRENKPTRSPFSRQFHYYPDCNDKSVEQMLFRRHLGEVPANVLELGFFSEMAKWASSNKRLRVVPYKISGISPPPGALSKSKIARFFFGHQAISGKQPLFAMQLIIGYLLGAWLFWLHPMWIWPRLNSIIATKHK
jgi:hypothetical protein